MAGKGTKNNQQNTQGDAQTEQAVQTKPLDFDVRIHSIKPNESIKGTASVNINGAFAIRGVKIIEGSNGLFVSMPSYKVGNEYKDICFPITQECRKRLNDAVIGAYEQAQMYGMEIGDYVASAYGGTAEDYEATLREQARLMAQRYLMLAAVASREGLTVSDEELNAQLESDASSYGYDGVDSYVEQSGLDKEAYREYMLIQKAMEYLTEHVKVVAQTQE